MSEPISAIHKPHIRFPDFQDAPAWSKKILEEYLTESRVKGSKGDVAKKITVKLWGKGVYEKNDEIKGSINTQYYIRSAGQFIYSKLDFLNQAFGIVPQTLDNYESTVDLPCFDINEGINALFLLEYVQRKEFYLRLGEAADGSRKAKRIHADTFLSFPIFKPDIEEQSKIAACLSSIDDMIAAHTDKYDALRQHKKGLMQQLFPTEGETIPKLRFPEFQNDGNWATHVIQDLAKVTTGNKDTQNKVDAGDYPFFVRSQTVERINSFSYDGEAILTSGDGVGVGKNFHYINGKFDFHQRVYGIYDFKNCVSGEFIYQYFSEQFYKRVMQLSAKNSVDSVRMSMITEMPICVPEFREQKKIAACLSSIDDLVTAQAQKTDSLRAFKKGLVQLLFPSAELAEA